MENESKEYVWAEIGFVTNSQLPTESIMTVSI